MVNVFSAEEEFLDQDPSVATLRRLKEREREREQIDESMRREIVRSVLT